MNLRDQTSDHEQQALLFADPAAPALNVSNVPPENAGPAAIARVLLEDNTLELDYLIPENLQARIKIGSRVHVPLQGRRAVAVVLQLLSDSPYKNKLKPIADTIGAKPVFPENLLKLAQWISSYYLCPLRQVLRTMLPQAVRQKPESFLSDSHLTLAN